jgi:hypothetical protein
MDGDSGRRRFLQGMGGLTALSLPPGSSAIRLVTAVEGAPGAWWKSIAAATPIFLRHRPGKDAVFSLVPKAAASRRLDEMRDVGIDMVEVYAPAEGGDSFLESGARTGREMPWRLQLPAYGHGFFQLSDRKGGA